MRNWILQKTKYFGTFLLEHHWESSVGLIIIRWIYIEYICILTLLSWKSLTSGKRKPAKCAAILAVYVAKNITLNAPQTLIKT